MLSEGGVTLDKNSKKILKYINKHSSKQNTINAQTLSEKTALDIDIVKEIAFHLNKDYLINIVKKAVATQDGLQFYNTEQFYPTNKGKEYFNVQRKEQINLYLRSIFCPIIVSLVTTLLTLLLKI